jgi:pilus assembly protein CpaE
MIDILLLSSSEDRTNAIAALLGDSGIGHSLRTESAAAKNLARHAALIRKADLLIVEDATLGQPELAAIEETIAHTPHLTCMLVAPVLSTDMLMAAMRAGVRHVLTWPVDPHEFARELSHVATKKSANARRAGRVTSFAAARGGCGTTLIAANLAHSLATVHDKRVLFVDLNQQFADASLLLSDKVPAATLNDLCSQIDRLDASLFEACVSRVHPNLDLLAGAGDPVKAGELRPSHLQRVLTLVRDHYDSVIFDIGQSINPLSIQALDQSEAICLALQQTIPHLHASRAMLDLFNQLGYAAGKTRLLVNHYDKRGQIGLDAIEKALGAKPFHLVPHDVKSARQAVNQGMPLLSVAKNAPLTKSLASLAISLWPRADAPARRGLGRLFAAKPAATQQLKPSH